MDFFENNFLDIKNISKSYVSINALNNVSLNIYKNEIHGLVGENGAGKSTLIKILTGLEIPDDGSIIFNGEKYQPTSPLDAQRKGIAFIHQDIHLMPDLSVAENIFMHDLPHKKFIGLIPVIDRHKLHNNAIGLLSALDIQIEPHILIRNLTAPEKRLIEIAKALSVNAKLFIMDEVTALLEHKEANILISQLEILRNKNVPTLFVSHKLDEIMKISDRITILRDGFKVDCVEKAHINESHLVNMITGKTTESNFTQPMRCNYNKIKVKINNLKLSSKSVPFSFIVRKGEIVSVTGLLSSYASKIVRALVCADSCEIESIQLDGKPIHIHSPQAAVKFGIGIVPEDRKYEGIIPDFSVKWNIAIANLDKICNFGIINRKKVNNLASIYIDKFRIRTPSVDTNIVHLSGGNQQKVLLARWFAKGTEFMLLQEPTHGIDVGAKIEVHALLKKFAETGGAILFYSTELKELCLLSDRVMILRHGCLVVDLLRSECSEEKILSRAAGVINK